jgi:hypothetical protein
MKKRTEVILKRLEELNSNYGVLLSAMQENYTQLIGSLKKEMQEETPSVVLNIEKLIDTMVVSTSKAKQAGIRAEITKALRDAVSDVNKLSNK